jgi:hypothetical protein
VESESVLGASVALVAACRSYLPTCLADDRKHLLTAI